MRARRPVLVMLLSAGLMTGGCLPETPAQRYAAQRQIASLEPVVVGDPPAVRLQTPWCKKDAFRRCMDKMVAESGNVGGGGYGPGAGGAAVLIILVWASVAAVTAKEAEEHAKPTEVIEAQTRHLATTFGSLDVRRPLDVQSHAVFASMAHECLGGASAAAKPCRMEITLREIGLRGKEEADPQLRCFARATVRLMQGEKRLYTYDCGLEGAQAMTFEQWERLSPRELQSDMERVMEQLMMHLAEEALAYEPI